MHYCETGASKTTIFLTKKTDAQKIIALTLGLVDDLLILY